ncbi:TetR family transcriptional regulator [Aquamicrobium ahrensii]|uniref:TetR family transcriptional regulator n=1 Tax=Aquamicrobium ahrensii TaxID=469551 RepID=UPI003395A59B
MAEAALEVGFHKLTMVAVAERLGVDHSSLYRHVRKRSDLLLAAADLAILRLEWRDGATHWRPYVETLAVAVWSLYQRYPGLADAMRSLDTTPPSAIRGFAEATAQLQALGFSQPDAVLVLDSIMDMTVDSASSWRRMARMDRAGAALARAGDEGPEDSSSLASRIQAITKVLSEDPEQWWRRKLALLLDGAELLLNRTSAQDGRENT